MTTKIVSLALVIGTLVTGAAIFASHDHRAVAECVKNC
jgi:hypothetical protein